LEVGTMKRALPTGEVALASKIFEQFFAAEVYEDIMACHQVAMLQNVFFFITDPQEQSKRVCIWQAFVTMSNVVGSFRLKPSKVV